MAFYQQRPIWITMDRTIVSKPAGKGVALGIIVAVIVTGIGVPLGFAVVLGIIFGLVAYIIFTDERKRKV